MARTLKKLGVIGGLGPITTACFTEMVVRLTDVRTDQEHIELLIRHAPQIPDRTRYILGQSTESPVEPMVEIGNWLADGGADFIVIPCITAHHFFPAFRERIHTRVLNAVEEVAARLQKWGYRRVGIMATDGSVRSGLFQKALSGAGITCVVPSEERQRDVMHVIYQNVKANLPVELERFANVARELRENGAEIIILGCTELSLVKRDYPIGPGFLDALEVLAVAGITYCGAPLRPDWEAQYQKDVTV